MAQATLQAWQTRWKNAAQKQLSQKRPQQWKPAVFRREKQQRKTAMCRRKRAQNPLRLQSLPPAFKKRTRSCFRAWAPFHAQKTFQKYAHRFLPPWKKSPFLAFALECSFSFPIARRQKEAGSEFLKEKC